jgi:hypothetical protein
MCLQNDKIGAAKTLFLCCASFALLSTALEGGQTRRDGCFGAGESCVPDAKTLYGGNDGTPSHQRRSRTVKVFIFCWKARKRQESISSADGLIYVRVCTISSGGKPWAS